MIGFETLEIVIGLAFVYLLFSILVTLLVEYASAIMSLRAKNLKKIIQRALDEGGSNPSKLFYDHPLIKYLGKKDGALPSYINSDKFSKVVLDLIRTGGDLKKLGVSSTLDGDGTKISKAIDELPGLGTDTKSLLKSFAKEANEEINEFGDRIESWFNETVERGQGWFNRKIKLITLAISLLVSVGLNIDSIAIYKQLSSNADLRTQIADGASAYMASADTTLIRQPELQQAYDSAKTNLISYYEGALAENTNMLNIGWPATENFNLWLAIVGWLISAFAISLGAPFWFDLLGKLVAIRSSRGSATSNSGKRQVVTSNTTSQK